LRIENVARALACPRGADRAGGQREFSPARSLALARARARARDPMEMDGRSRGMVIVPRTSATGFATGFATGSDTPPYNSPLLSG